LFYFSYKPCRTIWLFKLSIIWTNWENKNPIEKVYKYLRRHSVKILS
jgi:hypothetical protein